MSAETFSISSRFCGPPRSGNGGYVCGRVARHVAGPAVVRLKAPPPLEKPLQIDVSADLVQLRDESAVIAEGRSTQLEMAPPAPPLFEVAAEASGSYLGFARHPFPTCFVCGPRRSTGDGLRIFPGRVAGQS
ncbi:MAG TPA: hypothetical protein VFR86_09060, partial [Burkholderiaceae bacterium]|nr:hypothetical protein [Burkholderiaceae bacterium]